MSTGKIRPKVRLTTCESIFTDLGPGILLSVPSQARIFKLLIDELGTLAPDKSQVTEEVSPIAVFLNDGIDIWAAQ